MNICFDFFPVQWEDFMISWKTFSYVSKHCIEYTIAFQCKTVPHKLITENIYFEMAQILKCELNQLNVKKNNSGEVR